MRYAINYNKKTQLKMKKWSEWSIKTLNVKSFSLYVLICLIKLVLYLKYSFDKVALYKPRFYA